MTIIAYDGNQFACDSRARIVVHDQLLGQFQVDDNETKYIKIKNKEHGELLVFLAGDVVLKDNTEVIVSELIKNVYVDTIENGTESAAETLKGIYKQLATLIPKSVVFTLCKLHPIIVTRSGHIVEFWGEVANRNDDFSGVTVQILLHSRNLPLAWGSGAGVALGAMHAGADAKRAVEAAIKYIPTCGGKITVLNPQKLKLPVKGKTKS